MYHDPLPNDFRGCLLATLASWQPLWEERGTWSNSRPPGCAALRSRMSRHLARHLLQPCSGAASTIHTQLQNWGAHVNHTWEPLGWFTLTLPPQRDRDRDRQKDRQRGRKICTKGQAPYFECVSKTPNGTLGQVSAHVHSCDRPQDPALEKTALTPCCRPNMLGPLSPSAQPTPPPSATLLQALHSQGALALRPWAKFGQHKAQCVPMGRRRVDKELTPSLPNHWVPVGWGWSLPCSPSPSARVQQI